MNPNEAPSSPQSVSETEMMNRFFHQIHEVYLMPEIQRRRADGRIDDNFRIQAFQVIMNVSKGNEVRFNDEVRIAAQVRVKEGMQGKKVGDTFSTEHIDKFEDFILTSADGDAGHVTAIMIKDSWHLRYNFKYNTSKRREFLNTSNEFLRAAEFSLSQNHYRSMHENLFAAMEAGVIVSLISLPKESYLSLKKHKGWHSEINKWSKMGNINSKYVELYNELLDRRNHARYSDEPFSIDEKTAVQMIATASEFIKGLEETIPKLSSAKEDDFKCAN